MLSHETSILTFDIFFGFDFDLNLYRESKVKRCNCYFLEPYHSHMTFLERQFRQVPKAIYARDLSEVLLYCLDL